MLVAHGAGNDFARRHCDQNIARLLALLEAEDMIAEYQLGGMGDDKIRAGDEGAVCFELVGAKRFDHDMPGRPGMKNRVPEADRQIGKLDVAIAAAADDRLGGREDADADNFATSGPARDLAKDETQAGPHR
jgi:hypothetical protein